MIHTLDDIIQSVENAYLAGDIERAKEILFMLPPELASAVGAGAVCIPAPRFREWAQEYLVYIAAFQVKKGENIEPV